MALFKKHDDPERICLFCTNAKDIGDDEHMLCTHYGAVENTHTCKKFIYDYLKRKPHGRKKPEPLEFVDIND